MRLRRRDLLLATGAAMLTTGAGEAERAAAWLAAWDGQGIHRTATPGDVAGADWLASEVRALGGTVEIEEFALDRTDRMAGFVELDGARIQGEALFDAPDTAPGGVGAVGSTVDGQGLIGLAELSPLAVYSPEFAAMRRNALHRALVIVTRGERPGLALFNAESFRAPYGPAVLQVSSEHRDILFAAVARGAGLRVVVRNRRTPVRARNIVVTLPGRDPARAPVVVMTPRSSWWQSTSERGGGLVCWLEALRALVAEPPGCPVIFVATSGHELGHIGLDDFMARRPGWVQRATWLHFGANIGATDGKQLLQSPWDDLRDLASSEMAKAGQPADALSPKTLVPNGESRDIHRAGGRYITLVGSNPLFHLPQDRWPDAVNVAAVVHAAAAFARVAVAITR